VRQITFLTILILTTAMLPACASNDGAGSGAGGEASPAASETTESGSVDSTEDSDGAENSKADAENSDSSEVASKETASEADKIKENKCGAAGHPIKRLNFPTGATEATFTWTMNGFDDKQVVLIDMRAGQELRIEDIGDNPVTLSVCDPDGENVDDYDLSCHGRFKLEKTKKGDYTVFVTECKKADPWKGEYKLKVTAVDGD